MEISEAQIGDELHHVDEANKRPLGAVVESKSKSSLIVSWFVGGFERKAIILPGSRHLWKNITLEKTKQRLELWKQLKALD